MQEEESVPLAESSGNPCKGLGTEAMYGVLWNGWAMYCTDEIRGGAGLMKTHSAIFFGKGLTFDFCALYDAVLYVFSLS